MTKIKKECPPEDLEQKMTADMMEQEGMKENFELRKMFNNSFFFPICFDDAIIGVNPITQSIIYNYMKLGYLRILFTEWIFPDYEDTLYGGERMVEWIEGFTAEETEGKIQPTLCLNDGNKKYWSDVRTRGWTTH